MGKKKVIKQTEEEVLKEKDKLETAMIKAGKTESTSKGTGPGNGRVYINASYNNTMVAVTNKQGDVLAWASAGALGFTGPKKATPFAASKIVATVAEKLKKIMPMHVDVVVRGVGSGRDSAIRSLGNQGFNVMSIKDVTPIPHNGPRPPKVRRV